MGNSELNKNPRSSNLDHILHPQPAPTVAPNNTSTTFELQPKPISPTALHVLEALNKFQSYLAVLSNIVTSLKESLAVIVPETMSVPSFIDTNGKSQTAVNIPGLNTEPCTIYNDFEFEKKPKSTGLELFPTVFKYIGLICALFASVCISLVTLVVKFMDGYQPVTKVVWRLQGVFLPALGILLFAKFYQKKEIITWSSDMGQCKKTWKTKVLLLLLARGITGGTADIFQYYSLKYLPLADSTVISFSTPIFVCVAAHFLLNEKWGLVPIFSALLTLCGVIVIARPPILTGEETINSTIMVGNALAISCMICSTFTIVLMRRLKNVHFSLTMLALGLIGTIEGLVVSLFTSPIELPRIEMGYHDLLLAALTAGLFFFGQLAQTLALQFEEAGVVSLVRTCDVLFAFIWQVTCLQQNATVYSYVGAIIVTSGVCVTAARKWVNDMPDNSPLRGKLSFLLK